MLLSHYCNQCPSAVSPVEQEGDNFKPRGFWLSDDADEANWLNWCQSEGFHLTHLKHRVVYELNTNDGILWLKTPEELDQFSDRYGLELYHAPHSSPMYYHVDWASVATEYKGILITPYIWDRPLDHKSAWYYAWDVASACVWDPSCLTHISTEVVEKQKEPTND